MIRNKAISFTLACALFFAAVLPAYASISVISHNLENAEITKFYGDAAKILICTSDGFKYVSLADIQSGKISHESNKLHCKLCLASIGQDKVHDSLSNLYTELLHEITLEKQRIESQNLLVKQVDLQRHSRAPPHNS